jgi:hypothetical protein
MCFPSLSQSLQTTLEKPSVSKVTSIKSNVLPIAFLISLPFRITTRSAMGLERAALYLPCHQSTDLGRCAPERIVGRGLRNRVSLSIKPFNCQGGVGDRLLSPTGWESRGRGLPLPFGAVRHIYLNHRNHAWFGWYSNDLMVDAASLPLHND